MKITSVNNDLIKKILSYKETKVQKEEKKYLIEGLKMVDRALEKNKVELLLVESSIFKKYSHLKNVIEISANVAKKISDVKSTQNIFAVCNIEKNKKIKGNILILDSIQDPGNLGSLIRSAYAFDFKNIVCSFDSVSFYNPKVLRATQAHHFDLNLINDELVNFINNLKKRNIMVLGTFLKKTNQILKIKANQQVALILGNEGSGISNKLANLIDQNIKIKTNKDLESLNVAIAGSIIMYEIYSREEKS